MAKILMAVWLLALLAIISSLTVAEVDYDSCQDRCGEVAENRCGCDLPMCDYFDECCDDVTEYCEVDLASKKEIGMMKNREKARRKMSDDFVAWCPNGCG